MVNLDLDEAILQIFEEKEDVFHWPVKSQKDAKAFLKALSGKGVKHEVVYSEIGEYEHNFTAWRTGLGRQGIGKRVIDRINQPVQEVLRSDGESSDSESDDEDQTRHNGYTHNNRDHVDSNISPAAIRSNQTTVRASPVNSSSRRSAEQTNSRSSPVHSSPRFSRNAGQTTTSASHTSSSPVQSRAAARGVTKAAPWVRTTTSPDNSGCESSSDSSSATESTPSKVEEPASQIKQVSSLSSAPEQEHNNTAASSSPQDNTPEPSGSTQPETNSVSSEQQTTTDVSLSAEETVIEETVEVKQDNVTTKQPEKEEIANEKELQVKISVPMAEAEEDLDVSDNTSDTSYSGESDSEASENTEETGSEKTGENESKETDEAESKKTGGNESEETREVESEKTVETASEPRPVEVVDSETCISSESAETWETSDNSSSEHKSPPPDVNLQQKAPEIEVLEIKQEDQLASEPRLLHVVDSKTTCISSESGETWGSSSEYSSDEEDINENYDSDLDAGILEKEQDPDKYWQKALQAVTVAKSNSTDGPGFIYMMTDTPSGGAKCRVKVGASRCPQARFQQAALFNVDISLENMISVSKRRDALKEVSERLHSMQMSDNPGWFTGDMNVIEEIVNDVTSKYPIETSDC